MISQMVPSIPAMPPDWNKSFNNGLLVSMVVETVMASIITLYVPAHETTS